jgi:hypothetical protein
MLQRIEDLLAKDETFSIETPLATKSYQKLTSGIYMTTAKSLV